VDKTKEESYKMYEEDWEFKKAVWEFHNEVWRTKSVAYKRVIEENCPELLEVVGKEILEKVIKIRKELMQEQKRIKEYYRQDV